MKKFFNIIIKVLLWVWQFPQHLCALVYLINQFDRVDSPIRYYKRRDCEDGGAVTLGEYIFINKKYSKKTLIHEYGHVIQSRILGPFYLLVIGIPSILHAWLHDYICNNKDYYHFYTEKWANKLGDKYFVKHIK